MASDDAEVDEEVSHANAVTIDDELLRKAEELTGVTERSALLEPASRLWCGWKCPPARRTGRLGSQGQERTRRRQGVA